MPTYPLPLRVAIVQMDADSLTPPQGTLQANV